MKKMKYIYYLWNRIDGSNCPPIKIHQSSFRFLFDWYYLNDWIMKKIKLTKKQFALVDDEDFDFLNQIKWQTHKIGNTFYAYHGKRIGSKIFNYAMHRIIINPPNDLQIDHIDHNGLNNQKYNLRICNSAQNQMNKISNKKYKGVYVFYRGIKKYIKSNIKINNKLKHLGYFNTEKEAAEAYNIAAKELFGEFANINKL